MRRRTRVNLPRKRRQHLIHLLPHFRRSCAYLIAAWVHAIASCFTADMDIKPEEDDAAAPLIGAGAVEEEELDYKAETAKTDAKPEEDDAAAPVIGAGAMEEEKVEHRTENTDAKPEEDDAAAPVIDAGAVEEEEVEHRAEQQNERPPPRHHTPSNIFILAGQSNMSGRGGVRHNRWDRVVPLQCRPAASILRFSARSHWVEAREPLHADIDTAKTCGVGPGMPFAHAVLPHLLDDASSGPDAAAPVGLVPCAVGGTAIRDWERGTRLYAQMVRRAKEAVRGGGGGVRAVLWYQGESDTCSSHAADAYGANMGKLIRDVRQDLGLPSLPFIQVAIASGEAAARIETVRQAQLGMDLPNVVCVDAMGLPLNDDRLHLATDAQVRLGGMLAEAYIKNFVAVGAVAQASDPSLPTCP